MMYGISENDLQLRYIGYHSKKESKIQKTVQKKVSVSENSETEKTADAEKNSRLTEKESAVTDFIRRHPDKKRGVMEMVQAGKSVRKACGAEGVDTQSMSMSEYQSYISSLLGKIPFAPTRPYDEEAVFISQEGWEQMKNDPEYEAWVLGYTKVNRSVPDPFFGMGSAGSYGIEHFGASIDEHNGHSYSKLYGGSASAARGMYQTESRGGMTYKASKNRDIAKQLEKERLKKKRLQKAKQEKKTRKELEEHMLLMKQLADHASQQGIQMHNLQINEQAAAAFYETGFLFPDHMPHSVINCS